MVLDEGARALEPEGPDLFEVERRPVGTSWLALNTVGEIRLGDDITERLRPDSLFDGILGVGNIGSVFVPVALVRTERGPSFFAGLREKIEGGFDIPHPLPEQPEHALAERLDRAQVEMQPQKVTPSWTAPVSTMILVPKGWMSISMESDTSNGELRVVRVTSPRCPSWSSSRLKARARRLTLPRQRIGGDPERWTEQFFSPKVIERATSSGYWSAFSRPLANTTS